MKLICKDIRIDWMEGCGNNPDIVICGAQIPPRPKADEPVWQRHRDVHVAVNGDFAHFFATDGKPTHGFGGAQFLGTFVDGTTFDYHGAWSSRASAVNRLFEPWLVDVCFDNHITGHVVAQAVIDWRAANPRDWGLAWEIERSGERTLMPTRGGCFKNKIHPGSIVEVAVAS